MTYPPEIRLAALSMLARGYTSYQVADVCGCSEGIVRTWKKDPIYQKLLKEAQSELGLQLNNKALQAQEYLGAVMMNPEATPRRRDMAARGLLTENAKLIKAKGIANVGEAAKGTVVTPEEMVQRKKELMEKVKKFAEKKAQEKAQEEAAKDTT